MPPHESTLSRTWRVSPDLLGIADQNGVFVETNPSWQRVLGWSESEIRSKVFIDFLHPDDIDRTLALFGKMKKGAPALHFENRYLCKDGAYRWLSWVAVPEGDVFFCSARDITEDRERVQILKSIEDEAQLREQFIAILSHDLRNPLASIGSAVRIASREPHTDKAAQMHTAIEASVARMARLIDSTMDFARARLGGGIPVELECVDDLEQRFRRVIDEISLAHPENTIKFSHAFHGVLTCDAARLDQLLSNLVANAVVHGAHGEPIDVRTAREGGDFTLTVSNRGEPIPPDILRNPFRPFHRSKNTKSLQGLGLGLYIAAEIAKAHGGGISVESDEVTTAFNLRIPVDREM